MTTEVVTRRQAMEKAFDELEKEEETGGEVKRPEVSSSALDDKSEASHLDGKDGKEKSEETTDKKTEDEKSPEKKETISETDKKEKLAADKIEGKEEPKTVPPADRAPQSWKPAVREHWAKLPAEVRAEVNRRELEIQRTLSGTAQVRKFASDFAGIVQPVAHLIRQQGSTPLAAVHNLFNTAAALMTGNQDQKASIVAEIIGNYGIDIKILDSILAQAAEKGGGRIQPQVSNEGPPAWAQPLFGFMNQIQSAQQQREQQMSEDADEAILNFQDKPFFEDVRQDMADIMEMAANRGRKMTIQEGYDTAIKLRPDLAKIVEQRNAAANNGNGNIQRKKGAASTVSGAPSGNNVGANKKPTNRREAIEQAWEGNLS